MKTSEHPFRIRALQIVIVYSEKKSNSCIGI